MPHQLWLRTEENDDAIEERERERERERVRVSFVLRDLEFR